MKSHLKIFQFSQYETKKFNKIRKSNKKRRKLQRNRSIISTFFVVLILHGFVSLVFLFIRISLIYIYWVFDIIDPMLYICTPLIHYSIVVNTPDSNDIQVIGFQSFSKHKMRIIILNSFDKLINFYDRESGRWSNHNRICSLFCTLSQTTHKCRECILNFDWNRIRFCVIRLIRLIRAFFDLSFLPSSIQSFILWFFRSFVHLFCSQTLWDSNANVNSKTIFFFCVNYIKSS